MAVFVADEQDRTIDLERIRGLALHVLGHQRVPDAMELNILCVDVDSITQLNAHHMGASGPTDVLAFPMDLPGEVPPGAPAILGDVVVCPQVAADQAARRGHPAEHELELLVVHGILHLLGHDHAEQEERQVMFTLTDELLASFRADAGASSAGGDPT